jgi:hypothetical protein
MGAVVFRKRYSLREYVAASMMVRAPRIHERATCVQRVILMRHTEKHATQHTIYPITMAVLGGPSRPKRSADGPSALQAAQRSAVHRKHIDVVAFLRCDGLRR